MKELIQSRAAALGFDACRVTDGRSPESGEIFRRWLDDGCQGGMGYLERTADRRLDPQRVLPGVQSIVLLAVSYHRAGFPDVDDSRDPDRGVVARYARHRDYHDVLAGPLSELRRFLEELGGEKTRSLEYVDTGPILERDLAQRAGIGFIGKHTNLIGHRMGNWFFLASILTTLRLDPDEGVKNRCGTCRRCLDACPTRAITAPFRLDARRCISYLTIEHRGPIPEDLRASMGARIFGCDDCLAVCPWNRFAREGRLMREVVLPDLDGPSLVALLAMDEVTFRARFRGTPFERAKRRGLLRNVAVALGNIGDASALGPLERAARDSEPWIAEHARWAIGRIEARESSPGRASPAGESACSGDPGGSKFPPGDLGETDT
ncbi:MAG: tRNA epoxyqueuosine(34) reductase QueG [Limisphaerales bacterium]